MCGVLATFYIAELLGRRIADIRIGCVSRHTQSTTRSSYWSRIRHPPCLMYSHGNNPIRGCFVDNPGRATWAAEDPSLLRSAGFDAVCGIVVSSSQHHTRVGFPSKRPLWCTLNASINPHCKSRYGGRRRAGMLEEFCCLRPIIQQGRYWLTHGCCQ